MDRYAADRTVKRLARRAGTTKRISRRSRCHSFITAASTSLDACTSRRRDVQEDASDADPSTTMRYDRARQSRDRYATYIVVASGAR
jgi:integrase/recombinase XerD